MTTMTREKLKEEILAAVEYRSGTDSCNSLYMGSMARSQLLRHLGSSHRTDNTESALEKASMEQLEKAHAFCEPYLAHRAKHPTGTCPTCKTHGVPQSVIDAHDAGDVPRLILKGTLLLQKFDTFQDWVQHASRWLTNHPLYNNTEHSDGKKGWRGQHFTALCFDSKGRICRQGIDFQRAHDEDAFPVYWLWPDYIPTVVLQLAGVHK